MPFRRGEERPSSNGHLVVSIAGEASREELRRLASTGDGDANIACMAARSLTVTEMLLLP
jgi:hypothetical protein